MEVVVGVLDDVSNEKESKGAIRLDEVGRGRDRDGMADRDLDDCARADG